MRSLFLATALLLAGVSQAQSCGTLAITGSGAAGTQLTVALTGATANGYALLAVAENTGTTTIQLPMNGSLTLGLATPIIPLPLARTDANGDGSITFTVPSRLTTATNLNGQAVTLALSLHPFGISACASNVVAFAVGG
jgi:hypothetical protein